MNRFETNIDFKLDDPNAKSGEYGLWLRVFCEAINDLFNSRFPPRLAESYLFDPDNQFFDMVADTMGYEPDALRARIKKAAIKDKTAEIADLQTD